jgi:hypothetical protein
MYNLNSFRSPVVQGFVSFQVALSYPHEAEWTAFQTHCYSNLVVPGMEPGTSASAARDSDHWTIEAVWCTRRSPLTLSLEILSSGLADEDYFWKL